MPATAAVPVVESMLHLSELGRALARERDRRRLLEIILAEAVRLTSADGGALYRLDETGDTLSFEIVCNATLGWSAGTTPPAGLHLPSIPLHDATGTPNRSAAVAHAALARRSTRFDDVYAVSGFDFVSAKRFDAQFGYRTRSMLIVPMLDHDDELIGVVQLVNALDPAGAITEFTERHEGLCEAMTGLAGVVLSNQLLIENLESLFGSLVNLINVAIDEKSPYTSGHCQRVPRLTMMLAEAAHETSEGPLAPFRMSERDRAELWMAGMLHDCGKITTPVHVVDKATKLETIHDRIELVAARFDSARARGADPRAGAPARGRRCERRRRGTRRRRDRARRGPRVPAPRERRPGADGGNGHRARPAHRRAPPARRRWQRRARCSPTRRSRTSPSRMGR